MLIGFLSGNAVAGYGMVLKTGNDFDEGIEYELLENTVATETKNIEVRELFWYGCPHCYALEDNVQEWLESKSDETTFIRQPAIFSKRWKVGSDFYYILEKLGLVEEYHEKLFTAIHKERRRMESVGDLLTWLNSHGVEKNRTERYRKNFGIWMLSNKARKQTKKYSIGGVPTIIVGGKYSVSTKSAGSEAMVFKVVDFLVEKIKKGEE